MTGAILQTVTTATRRGAEVFALDLADALRPHGWATESVALVAGGATDLLPLEVLGDRRLGWRTLRGLHARLRHSSVAIGHGSSTLPALVASGVATKTPLIYRSVGDPRYWAQSRLRRIRVGRLLSRTNAVVALTAGAASELMRAYGVQADKITIIPKGVPAARFPLVTAQARIAARTKLGIDDDAPVISFVGALSPEKRVADAIRAAAVIDKAQLVIAGDGPDRAELQTLAAGVAPGRVRFVGTVADPRPVFAAADAVVLSSATEGLPGVLMEAGLSGIPAVTTDAGWAREIVLDGETGYVVKPGHVGELTQRLRDVLTDGRDMGDRARAHCLAHFEITEVAVKWDALLTRLGDGRA